MTIKLRSPVVRKLVKKNLSQFAKSIDVECPNTDLKNTIKSEQKEFSKEEISKEEPTKEEKKIGALTKKKSLRRLLLKKEDSTENELSDSKNILSQYSSSTNDLNKQSKQDMKKFKLPSTPKLRALTHKLKTITNEVGTRQTVSLCSTPTNQNTPIEKKRKKIQKIKDFLKVKQDIQVKNNSSTSREIPAKVFKKIETPKKDPLGKIVTSLINKDNEFKRLSQLQEIQTTKSDNIRKTEDNKIFSSRLRLKKIETKSQSSTNLIFKSLDVIHEEIKKPSKLHIKSNLNNSGSSTKRSTDSNSSRQFPQTPLTIPSYKIKALNNSDILDQVKKIAINVYNLSAEQAAASNSIGLFKLRDSLNSLQKQATDKSSLDLIDMIQDFIDKKLSVIEKLKELEKNLESLNVNEDENKLYTKSKSSTFTPEKNTKKELVRSSLIKKTLYDATNPNKKPNIAIRNFDNENYDKISSDISPTDNPFIAHNEIKINFDDSLMSTNPNDDKSVRSYYSNYEHFEILNQNEDESLNKKVIKTCLKPKINDILKSNEKPRINTEVKKNVKKNLNFEIICNTAPKKFSEDQQDLTVAKKRKNEMSSTKLPTINLISANSDEIDKKKKIFQVRKSFTMKRIKLYDGERLNRRTKNNSDNKCRFSSLGEPNTNSKNIITRRKSGTEKKVMKNNIKLQKESTMQKLNNEDIKKTKTELKDFYLTEMKHITQKLKRGRIMSEGHKLDILNKLAMTPFISCIKKSPIITYDLIKTDNNNYNSRNESHINSNSIHEVNTYLTDLLAELSTGKIDVKKNNSFDMAKDSEREVIDASDRLYNSDCGDYFSVLKNNIFKKQNFDQFNTNDNSFINDKEGIRRSQSLVFTKSEIESLSLENHLKKDSISIRKISINDFEIIKPLSHGAFGCVCLARKKISGDYFAIKILDRKLTVEKNQVDFVHNERNILSMISNDFFVRGVYTFQTEQYLYFVMEFMVGGDFATLLGNLGALEEKYAKNYIAEIVLALEHMHKNDIVHRDLKPDNILIDSSGHLKLTDFGLSELGLQTYKENILTTPETEKSAIVTAQKLRNDKWDVKISFDESDKVMGTPKIFHKKINNQPKKRILGTPDYLAPEVIKGDPLTKVIDWWSLGVIIYEFIVGIPPFNDSSPEIIFDNILKHKIEWPEIGYDENQMSPEAFDIINKLLNQNPAQRLGSNGIDEIKNHPFFKGVNWENIRSQPVPFLPKPDSLLDTQYFASDKKNFSTENFKIGGIIENIENKKIDIWRTEANKHFKDFETTVIDTLVNINKERAKEALGKPNEDILNKSGAKIDYKKSYYVGDSPLSNDLFYEEFNIPE